MHYVKYFFKHLKYVLYITRIQKTSKYLTENTVCGVA